MEARSVYSRAESFFVNTITLLLSGCKVQRVCETKVSLIQGGEERPGVS